MAKPCQATLLMRLSLTQPQSSRPFPQCMKTWPASKSRSTSIMRTLRMRQRPRFSPKFSTSKRSRNPMRTWELSNRQPKKTNIFWQRISVTGGTRSLRTCLRVIGSTYHQPLNKLKLPRGTTKTGATTKWAWLRWLRTKRKNLRLSRFRVSRASPISQQLTWQCLMIAERWKRKIRTGESTYSYSLI